MSMCDFVKSLKSRDGEGLVLFHIGNYLYEIDQRTDEPYIGHFKKVCIFCGSREDAIIKLETIASMGVKAWSEPMGQPLVA